MPVRIRLLAPRLVSDPVPVMPPESVAQPLARLDDDPVGDVRAAASALAKKIERVSAAADQSR